MDWHGQVRRYDDVRGRHATLRAAVASPLRLDRRGVFAAWGELDDPRSTVALGVRRVFDETPLAARGEALHSTSFEVAFEASVAAIARDATAPALALGGGLDGAAVLAAWRTSGFTMPHVVTLATGLEGYDETRDALEIAKAFDCTCDVVETTSGQIVALVPEASAIAESPLYNLHPVYRLALARSVAARGHGVLVTGDGGDAVFRGRPDYDYVPIVAALTRAAALDVTSPYFAPAVIAAIEVDPSRRALRAYLARHGLRWLCDRPKKPRWMPALDLAPLVDRERLKKLAHTIDVPLDLSADRRRVGWITFDYLVRDLER